MMITAKCLGCGKLLNIPEASLGSKMMCRHCGVLFVMALPTTGYPSLPVLWDEWTHGEAANPTKRSGNYVVPVRGVVGTETGRNLIAVSDTGVYEAVRGVGTGTSYYPRIVKSKTGSYQPVDSQSEQYRTARRRSSSARYKPVDLPTIPQSTIYDKTHKYAPVGVPALGYRKARSSAELSVLPRPSKYPGFNLLQIASVAALLIVTVVGFVFFFGPYSPPRPKAPIVLRPGESIFVPATYTVQEADRVDPGSVGQTPQVLETPTKIEVVAPKTTQTVAPTISIPEPKEEIIQIPQTEKTQLAASGGAFDSINRAMSALPAASKKISIAEQAEVFALHNQHNKASQLYEQAAEESERLGRSEEAQLFTLKSIEETRIYQSDTPHLPPQVKP